MQRWLRILGRDVDFFDPYSLPPLPFNDCAVKSAWASVYKRQIATTNTVRIVRMPEVIHTQQMLSNGP